MSFDGTEMLVAYDADRPGLRRPLLEAGRVVLTSPVEIGIAHAAADC